MKTKALSFRQPWATLVLEGKKTLDLRTWNTHYRGPLAVYASQEIENDACASHGLDPKMLSTGVLIGLVDLVNIVPLNEESYAKRQSEHLGGRPFRPGLFGWELQNPRPLHPPRLVKGRLNLFDVELDENLGKTTATHLTTDRELHKPVQAQSSEYELRVIPDGQSYRLAFIQTLVESNPAQLYLYQPPAVKPRVMVELGGDPLRAIAEMVLNTLRQNGYKPTDLGTARLEPFRLSEETGVRVGLVFLAVKPVTKVNRIDAIMQGIRMMTPEELYYWYSKCTGGLAAERAQKALRILLSNE